MSRKLILEIVVANILVAGGLYAYLMAPNFMDITWGVSFALAIVLLLQTIERELENRYLAGSFLSVIFLSWNIIAGTGMRDFYITSLGMTYHGVVIRTTLAVLIGVLIVFLKGRHRDLKIISALILLFQILGAVWAAKAF